MKIVITTENMFVALRLKSDILKTINGNVPTISIDTWSYQKAAQDYDIIYHNALQYTQDPTKNVLFRVVVNDSNVMFIPAWWTKNPEPSREIVCIHIGRLAEMLLRYFPNYMEKFSILDVKN